jgi:ABC-type antimicrobial peptide transport system permease subunit
LAVAALLVTGVGLFGVLSYAVSQRTRELGIRAALGASRLELMRLVLRQATIVCAVGTSVGLLASIWFAGSVRSLLYDVTPGDLVSYVAVPVVLIVVAVIACIQPARKAARLDPVKALRS